MGSASYPSVLGSSVQTAEVDDLAISTAKIAAKAVTKAKMADGTAYKILGFDAAGVAAEIGSLVVELIENHKATGAESSKTFTLPSAFDPDVYSELVLIIDMHVTAALDLLATINANATANYWSTGVRVSGSADTFLSYVNQANFKLATSNILAAANQAAHIEVHFHWIGEPTSRQFTGRAFVTGANSGAFEEIQLMLNRSQITTSSIEITTSTSTWAAGTRMSLYGVKRV